MREVSFEWTNLRLESSEASDPEDLSALELRRSCEFRWHLRIPGYTFVKWFWLQFRSLGEEMRGNDLIRNAVNQLKGNDGPSVLVTQIKRQSFENCSEEATATQGKLSFEKIGSYLSPQEHSQS